MKTYTFVHKDTGAFVSVFARDYPHALDMLGLIVKDMFQFTEQQAVNPTPVRLPQPYKQ